ncbi:MFS transporter, partial [Pediococcus acidilactici]|nr:MFS transporter [Pediococcus acidilactici]
AKFGDRANHRIFYFVGAAMAAASWIVLTYAGMNWTSLWLFVILWGVSAGIWSIIFPTILTSMGFKAAGTFMIALLIVSLVIGTVWTPHTRGKSLEQISKERYGNDQD